MDDSLNCHIYDFISLTSETANLSLRLFYLNRSSLLLLPGNYRNYCYGSNNTNTNEFLKMHNNENRSTHRLLQLEIMLPT